MELVQLWPTLPCGDLEACLRLGWLIQCSCSSSIKLPPDGDTLLGHSEAAFSKTCHNMFLLLLLSFSGDRFRLTLLLLV